MVGGATVGVEFERWGHKFTSEAGSRFLGRGGRCSGLKQPTVGLRFCSVLAAGDQVLSFQGFSVKLTLLILGVCEVEARGICI